MVFNYSRVLQRVASVVQMLEDKEQHILRVVVSPEIGEPSIQIEQPIDKGAFSGTTAGVVRGQRHEEWSVDFDGVHVFWLVRLDDKMPELRRETL